MPPDFPAWLPFAVAFLLITVLIVLDCMAAARWAKRAAKKEQHDA